MSPLGLILLIVIIVLLFGGGFGGTRLGWYGTAGFPVYGYGIGGFLLLIVVVLLVLGRL